MQQRPEQRTADSRRTQRIQQALPGVTPSTFSTPRPGPSPMRKARSGWRILVLLFGLGLLLEVLYIALYPLLLSTTRSASSSQQVQQALPRLFPWLAHLYWTTTFPVLPRLLSSISWLNILNENTRNDASVRLSVLLLGMAGVIVLLAAWTGGRGILERLSRIDVALLFWTMLLLTGLFSGTMLFAPGSLNAFSQDMLLYGLYGRMVVVYHVNPYAVAPTAFPTDMLQALVGARSPTPYGPIWTDLSLLVTLLAGKSIANVLIGFRLLGLTAHLANAALLWFILARTKPQTRLSAALLYAWNPLILLFGIAEMHQEIVLVFLVLLAILFFQRSSPTIGWVFVLLAVLVNLLWLPLLPLFFRLMAQQSGILRWRRRILWWIGMLTTSLLVLALAYAPYWRMLGLFGIVAQLRHTFLPDTALNSLDAALLRLATNFPSPVLELLSPSHWAWFVLGIMGLFLLLGLWLANTLELVILFACWLLLLLVFLLPVYWPWYAIVPFALALCSSNRRTILLALLLMAGTLLSYYWLLSPNWTGQALLTIGAPLILWGWILFFSFTWQIFVVKEEERAEKLRPGFPGLSRPPWLSRPPRSDRR